MYVVFQICNILPSHLLCIYSYFLLIYLICCFSHVIQYCLYKHTWRLHNFFLIVFNPSPIIRSYRIFIISYLLYWCWCSHSFESASLTLTWFWASWSHFPSKSLALDSWVLRWFSRKFIFSKQMWSLSWKECWSCDFLLLAIHFLSHLILIIDLRGRHHVLH